MHVTRPRVIGTPHTLAVLARVDADVGYRAHVARLYPGHGHMALREDNRAVSCAWEVSRARKDAGGRPLTGLTTVFMRQ